MGGFLVRGFQIYHEQKEKKEDHNKKEIEKGEFSQPLRQSRLRR